MNRRMSVDTVGDFDFRGLIDREVFSNLLAGDKDAKRQHSKTYVFKFIDDAEKAMAAMKAADDLPEIGKQAGLLAIEAGLIGAFDIQALCENIQHYGTFNFDPDDDDEILTDGQRLKRIEPALEEVQTFYTRLAPLLKMFYREKAKA